MSATAMPQVASKKQPFRTETPFHVSHENPPPPSPFVALVNLTLKGLTRFQNNTTETDFNVLP
jgi:hypothetical protein